MRELLQVAGMWFGLGEPGETGDPRRDWRYLTVQTVLAIGLGALAAVARGRWTDTALPAAWPPAYVLLAIPLAIAVARDPGRSVLYLSGAAPAGVVVVIAAALFVPGDGFWWWFPVMATATLVAGMVFGALRRVSLTV